MNETSTQYIRDFTGHADVAHQSPTVLSVLTRLEQGESLTPEETLGIAEDCRKHKGVYRLMGWEYNFRPFLTKYVVKTDHYLEECYALNKADARILFKGLGRVQYIVEVPK